VAGDGSDGLTDRSRISSGGPWEDVVGYSRAIVVGDSCWVSGTTDAGSDGRSRHPGDMTAQARAALEIITAALTEAGFSLGDVVRTRMFVTDISRAGEVNGVHADVFRDVRPAATMVEVAALIDPSLLIEIEAEACRSGQSSQAVTPGSQPSPVNPGQPPVPPR
jgi:enamine deaminase RidA (YjgF/YER057c/UK114 family)